MPGRPLRAGHTGAHRKANAHHAIENPMPRGRARTTIAPAEAGACDGHDGGAHDRGVPVGAEVAEDGETAARVGENRG